MVTLKQTLNRTREWSINRLESVVSISDKHAVMNGDSIRQEFDEWITAKDKNSDEDIISMAYIGEESEYDI